MTLFTIIVYTSHQIYLISISGYWKSFLHRKFSTCLYLTIIIIVLAYQPQVCALRLITIEYPCLPLCVCVCVCVCWGGLFVHVCVCFVHSRLLEHCQNKVMLRHRSNLRLNLDWYFRKLRQSLYPTLTILCGLITCMNTLWDDFLPSVLQNLTS